MTDNGQSTGSPLWPNTVPSPIQVAILMALVCSLFFHGSELVNFSIDPDEENVLGKIDPFTYVLLGRWGAYLLLRFVLPETIFPITATAIFLTAYGCAFIILVYCIRVSDWKTIFIASPLYFGFPTLLYIVAWNNVAFMAGVGCLAAAVSLWLAQKSKPLALTISALLLIFAIATYQSVLWFAFIIFASDLLLDVRLRDDARKIFLKTRRYILLFSISVALYVAITYLILYLNESSFAYVQSYVRVDALFRAASSIISRTLASIAEIYGGYAPTFVGQGLYYTLLFLCLTVLVLWRLFNISRESIATASIAGALLLLILIAPFFQNPTAGGFMPYRTLIGVPAALAIFAFFGAENASDRIKKWLLLPLAVLVIIEFSAINNKQYYAGYWRTERDKFIAAELILRIKEIAPTQKIYKLAVVGNAALYNNVVIPDVLTSSFHWSIFSILGGHPARISNFLRFFSDSAFLPVSPDEWQRASIHAENMPVWPSPGSVALVDGVFIVHFGTPTPLQRRLTCRGDCPEVPRSAQ